MMIDLYAGCLDQIEHDKIRCQYFKPMTIVRTIYQINLNDNFYLTFSKN